MKRLITIIILLCVISTANAEMYEFAGARLGMTLEETKAAVGPSLIVYEGQELNLNKSFSKELRLNDTTLAKLESFKWNGQDWNVQFKYSNYSKRLVEIRINYDLVTTLITAHDGSDSGENVQAVKR